MKEKKEKINISQDSKDAKKAEKLEVAHKKLTKSIENVMKNGEKLKENGNEFENKELEKKQEKRNNFIKYITSLYKQLSISMQSIEELLLKIECDELKKELSNQLTDFDLIARECEMIAKSEEINLKENNLFEKIILWSSLNFNTIIDKRVSHITEVMIIGTISGLIQCLKLLKDYKEICPELDDICNKIIDLDEKNYQTLKKFI